MNWLKSSLLAILSNRLINVLLRTLIKPIKDFLPVAQLVRFPVVGQVPVKYSDLTEFVMITDGKDSLASRIYWQGINAFEAAETTVYRELLNSAETVLDIGANTGLYSLIAGVHPKPTTVYTFEPMPIIAETLRRNIAVNNLSHVQLHEIALTDSDGEITLYVPIQPTLPMGSSTDENFRRNTMSIQVKAMKLDTFVFQSSIEKVDLMKIDTESTEPAVLRGGANLIKRDRPFIMCEILGEKSATAIGQFFVDQDYQVFRIAEEGIRQIETIVTRHDATNFLFVPTEKLPLLSRLLDTTD